MKNHSKMIISKKSHHFHLRGLCVRGNPKEEQLLQGKKAAKAVGVSEVSDVLHLEVVLSG